MASHSSLNTFATVQAARRSTQFSCCGIVPIRRYGSTSPKKRAVNKVALRPCSQPFPQICVWFSPKAELGSGLRACRWPIAQTVNAHLRHCPDLGKGVLRRHALRVAWELLFFHLNGFARVPLLQFPPNRHPATPLKQQLPACESWHIAALSLRPNAEILVDHVA